jgi:two-component system chemotaxis response regulator CheY
MKGVTAGVVLLVEDNQDALEIYGISLRAAGYEVIEAPTLAIAEDEATKRTPSVIVLDRNLPDGDGLERVALWRTNGLLAGVPIIMLTASGSRTTEERAHFGERDAFLVKPCPGSVLVEHVGRAIAAVSRVVATEPME